MTSTAVAKDVRWNLGDLYASPEDPCIEADLNKSEQLALAFEKKYKPWLEKISGSNQLPALLRDFKELAQVMTKPAVYSHLLFAEKTNDAAVAAFMQQIRTRLTDIENHLVFFQVGWARLDEKTVKPLIEDPAVAQDLHFLEHLRIYAPHTLSEGEEKIMAIKSNTGGHAFSRLFDETMNNIPFYLETEAGRVKKTEAEVLALFHSTDRSTRQKASNSLAEGLKSNTHLLTYIYNMILADHRSSMKIRNYKHPMDGRNLANEIDLASVQNLVKSVKGAYPIAWRYYDLKRRLLGLDELFDYDRYAPVSASEERHVSFDECKTMVLSGYHAFSNKAGEIAEMFFEKRWIDAEVREGKQGGAFSCQTTPDVHPYVLVNYTGRLRDVLTVAHELGHGIHQYLAARKVGILECDAPLTLAETASVFGEILIFEKILEKETDPKKRLGLICGKIDDEFATVFRQIAMTDFELMAHMAGLEKGELSSEELSDLWIRANADFYGKSVSLTENYRHGWKYIPHFVHTPFYCYAYAFAQLFVLALYQKYKQDRGKFVPAYFEMLSLGGSRKPAEIAALQGLDIHDPGFFKLGLNILDNFVGEAEKAAAALKL